MNHQLWEIQKFRTFSKMSEGFTMVANEKFYLRAQINKQYVYLENNALQLYFILSFVTGNGPLLNVLFESGEYRSHSTMHWENVAQFSFE